MPPKSASEVAVAASPVAVPAVLEPDDEDAEPDVVDEDELAELDDDELDEELDDPALPVSEPPQPATTRASAASAATAPVRDPDRGRRVVRTNDLLVNRCARDGQGLRMHVAKGESPFAWRSL